MAYLAVPGQWLGICGGFGWFAGWLWPAAAGRLGRQLLTLATVLSAADANAGAVVGRAYGTSEKPAAFGVI
jgi:hypothetical protein